MELNEFFKRKYLELTKEGNHSYADPGVISQILSDYTGEVANQLVIPKILKSYNKIHLSPTDEDIKSSRAVYEGIIRDYGMVKDFYTFSEFKGDKYYLSGYSGYSRNADLKSIESLIFGKNFICPVLYSSANGVPSIVAIFYTQSSEDAAKDIWIRHSEECLRIVQGHDEIIEKSYEVTTVLVGEGGVYNSVTTSISPTVSLVSPDFMNNYNSDFPESKVCEFLKINRGGIMIFNGHPGCGKSTYLKSLIFRYPDINFVILPQYLLLNQESFRNFLFQMTYGERDCVYIVEDCEQLLIQRESNNAMFSSIIGDILNYTDGIFGDLTRTKFIFTFNTDLGNIDKAILRPGRLSLKYEFTPLKGENLEKVAEKLGKTLTPEDKKNGVPLADLYTGVVSEDLQIGCRPKSRIGFNVTEEDLIPVIDYPVKVGRSK